MISLRTPRTALATGPLVALLAGGVVAVVPAASAAELPCARFASTSGADTNAGTQSSPYRTVQKLVGSLSAGQAGCLAAGTYTGNVTLARSSTTLRSVPGVRATLSLSTLTIPAGANDVTVSDLNIVGGGGALTMRPIGSRFTITRNDITNRHQGLSCILVGSQADKSLSGTVSRNRIHHCGQVGSTLDHGVYAQNFGRSASTVPGLTVEDNVFHSMGAYSVQLYPNGVGALVQRNVMDGGSPSTRGGVVIDGGTASGHRIERNIIVGTRTGGIVQRTGSGHTAKDNCFFQNGGADVSGSGITRSGNLNADPRFVNRSAGDYRLAPDSPCLAKVGQDTAALLSAPAPASTTSPAPTTSPSPTQAPSPAPTTPTSSISVAVSSPVSGASVGSNLRAIATASSSTGRITKVELLVDGVLRGTETSAPYDQWLDASRLALGTHLLTARAYDDRGGVTSASVSFRKV